MKQRLLSKVVIDEESGCWIFTGAKTKDGYGHINIAGRMQRAHRVAYAVLNGPLISGLEIDHLCRNRRCVNPQHLELVTKRENVMRGTAPSAQYAKRTHCKNGHPFNEANTFERKRFDPKAGAARGCRRCDADRQRRYRQRVKERRTAA